MNKRANLVWDNAIYLILVVLFFAGMILFINQQRNGAGVWEDFYAKEISKAVNLAKPGDEIIIDIHKARVSAKKNNVQNFDAIVAFDNANQEVCVKLNLGRQMCQRYFPSFSSMDWKRKTLARQCPQSEKLLTK